MHIENFWLGMILLALKKSARIMVILEDAEHAGLQALSEKCDVALSYLARKEIQNY